METVPEMNTPRGLRISTYKQPPTDFNVLTASQKVLRDFGIPSRPDKKASPKYYALWERMFSRKMTYIVPTFSRLKGIRHGLCLRKETMSAESSLNWSGLVAYAPAGSSLHAITSAWNIPNLERAPQTVSAAYYFADQWIGIDGDGGSRNSFQAGTEAVISSIPGDVLSEYYAWWQWFPEQPYVINNLLVAPGVIVECLVEALTATSGLVYLANINENVATSFNVTAPAEWTLAGNCAEWIVERPCVNSQLLALPDYTTVFFDHSVTVNRANTVVTELYLGSATTVTMMDGNSVLSMPQVESDTLAKVYWVTSGKSRICQSLFGL